MTFLQLLAHSRFQSAVAWTLLFAGLLFLTVPTTLADVFFVFVIARTPFAIHSACVMVNTPLAKYIVKANLINSRPHCYISQTKNIL